MFIELPGMLNNVYLDPFRRRRALSNNFALKKEVERQNKGLDHMLTTPSFTCSSSLEKTIGRLPGIEESSSINIINARLL